MIVEGQRAGLEIDIGVVVGERCQRLQRIAALLFFRLGRCGLRRFRGRGRHVAVEIELVDRKADAEAHLLALHAVGQRHHHAAGEGGLVERRLEVGQLRLGRIVFHAGIEGELAQPVARHILDRTGSEGFDQRAQIAGFGLQRAVEVRLPIHRRQDTVRIHAAAARQLGRGVLQIELAVRQLHRDRGLVDRLALVDDLLDRDIDTGRDVGRQRERFGGLGRRRLGRRLRAFCLRLARRHHLVQIDAADRDIGLHVRGRGIVGGNAQLGGQIAEIGGEVVGPGAGLASLDVAIHGEGLAHDRWQFVRRLVRHARDQLREVVALA